MQPQFIISECLRTSPDPTLKPAATGNHRNYIRFTQRPLLVIFTETDKPTILTGTEDEPALE
ncbi:hypothetical protein AWY96_21360 [Serratia plymuthica]|nr:hypothetical protein AWY96_21360 [Serratia plymuthica]